MTKIGLLSDTHGFIDDRILHFFENCNEIWHAGDIGSFEIIKKLSENKSVRAVYGNIDGQEIRTTYKKHCRFMCEKVDVWITHIGGYPKRYAREVKPEIYENSPDLFISGHSHILKVMFDKKIDCLHINPGAAGINGFHKVRTAVRLSIDKKNISDLEILEIPRK